MSKSEDQIARDKEAVAKMRSAKASMEAAIRRIEELERGLKACANLHKEFQKVVSQDAYIKTHYGTNNGTYTSDPKIVPAHLISGVIATIVSELT